MTDPQKLAPSSQLIRSVFKNQTGFGHQRLITREKFACFDFEFSLAIRSLSKYQTRFGYTRLRQFPRFPFEFSLAIRSVSKTKRNSVSCVWLHVSSLLVFTLSSHWLLVTFVWILIGRCDYFGFSIFDTESKFTLLQTQLRHWLDFLLLFGFVFGVLDIST